MKTVFRADRRAVQVADLKPAVPELLYIQRADVLPGGNTLVLTIVDKDGELLEPGTLQANGVPPIQAVRILDDAIFAATDAAIVTEEGGPDRVLVTFDAGGNITTEMDCVASGPTATIRTPWGILANCSCKTTDPEP